MAKERGLKVSGKKADLAERLADAGVSKSAVEQDDMLLICTDYARPLVESYKEEKSQARKYAQRAALKLLMGGKLKEACELVADFEQAQYFQRGMNVNWSTQAPELLRRIKSLMKAEPAYLIERFDKVPDEARLLASMSALWGVNSFEHLRSELIPTEMTEKDIFLCSDALRSHHPTGNAAAEIAASRLQFLWECVSKDAAETCEVCRNADGQTYQPGDEPELPHVGCECETGCRCLYTHKLIDF